VTLAASGQPDSVGVSFASSTLVAGYESSELVITVERGVAAADYPITITGSGTGAPDQTATLTLRVTGADAGSVALTADSGTVAITAGSAARTDVITLTRTAPFGGDVAMTVTGQPPEMTATMSPTIIAAGSATSTLSVSATKATVNGSYTLVVRGTATGVADATTNVVASVLGGTPPPPLIALTLDPTTLTVAGGGAAKTSVLTVKPRYPSGQIGLGLHNIHAGVTATITPQTIGAGSRTGRATISVSANTSAAVGVDSILIWAMSGGATRLATGKAILPVTITASSSGMVAKVSAPKTLP